MDQGRRDELSPSSDTSSAGDAKGAQDGTSPLLPWKLLVSHWRGVLRRLWNETSADNLWVVAAGVAFYALLAIIPAIAALFSIYGLVAEPAEVEQQLRQFEAVLPSEVVEILTAEFARNAALSSGDLSLRLVGSFLVLLWSANRGMKALIAAVVIAYDEEDRGFLRQNALALAFTVAAIVGVCIALGLLVALPSVIDFIGLEERTQSIVTILRWPVLFVSLLLALGVLYARAPRRSLPRWRWSSPGALIATVLWLVGSWLFSIYVTRYGNYSELYGSLGAVVTLLLWFFVSAYVIALGAELNAIIEAKAVHKVKNGDIGTLRLAGDEQLSGAAGSRP